MPPCLSEPGRTHWPIGWPYAPLDGEPAKNAASEVDNRAAHRFGTLSSLILPIPYSPRSFLFTDGSDRLPGQLIPYFRAIRAFGGDGVRTGAPACVAFPMRRHKTACGPVSAGPSPAAPRNVLSPRR